MKKLNVVATIVCLLPLSAVGAAIADETNARERGERQQHERMIVVERSGERGEMRERMQEVRSERLREHFTQFDLNQDGYITQAELTEVMVKQARERSEQMFQRLDTDGTGMVSVERFAENQGGMHAERRIEMQGRAVNMRELSEEDRERIRGAREQAREARAAAGEARRQGMVIRGEAVEVSVDEEGNRIIRVKKKDSAEHPQNRRENRGNN